MIDVWVLKPPSLVLLEEIDDFLACYSKLTGDTHIFDAFPAEIVKMLASAPASGEQIRIHMAQKMGEKSGDRVDTINDTLRQLEYLQLVEIQAS